MPGEHKRRFPMSELRHSLMAHYLYSAEHESWSSKADCQDFGAEHRHNATQRLKNSLFAQALWISVTCVVSRVAGMGRTVLYTSVLGSDDLHAFFWSAYKHELFGIW